MRPYCSFHGLERSCSFSNPLPVIAQNDPCPPPCFSVLPDVTKNPNVPIGSVVCIIFNPKHEEDLMALHDMYPPVIEQETAEQAYKLAGARARYLREYSTEFTGRQKLLHFQHRFRFTGTIRDFSRKTLQSVSLQCVDFVVSDIDVISSELLNELEDWRTEVSLMAPTIVDDD